MNDSLQTVIDSLNVLLQNYTHASDSTGIDVFLHSAQQSSQWISPAIWIAFLALFIGPTVQLIVGWKSTSAQEKISRNSIRADVYLKRRQEWRDTVRDFLAEYVSKLYMMSFLKDDVRFTRQEKMKLKEEAAVIRSQLSMLLDQGNSQHKDVFVAILEATQSVNNQKSSDEEVYKKLFKIEEAARKMFDAEIQQEAA